MLLDNVDLDDYLTKTLLPVHRQVVDRCKWIDGWAGAARNPDGKPRFPRQATAEYRTLSDLSATPWGDLIVNALVEMLYVEGYRKTDGTALPGWKAWQRNGMDARQIPLHYDAVKYGLAYATVLPSGVGSKVASIRPKSPKHMTAFYVDAVDDEWPAVALELKPLARGGAGGYTCKLYDDAHVWTLQLDANGRRVSNVTRAPHGQGHVPVVRYCNRFDLEGNTLGEVEPFISMFHRIDQTIFDRLVVQRFASFVVRTISGMAPPDGVPESNVELTTEQQDALNAAKIRLAADFALVSDDPNTKFGSLPASPLDPFVAAKDSDLRDLAAVSQTARSSLLGIEANMGSEALASEEKGQTRKAIQRRHTLGESHEQTLALAERIEGQTNDELAQVTWLDTEPMALPSVADALVKLRDVKLPQRAIFERVPGATQTDVDAWLKEVDASAGAEGTLTPQDMKTLMDAMGVAIRSGADPASVVESLGLSLSFTGAVPVSLRLPTEDATGLEGASGGLAASG